MIFTMDVGNTNIKTALFEGREMRKYWRISTNTSYTSDEYGLILEGLFARAGLSMDAVEGIVMSSVVPTINFTLEHMCKNYFGKMPMTVAPGIKTGINLYSFMKQSILKQFPLQLFATTKEQLTKN